MISTAPSFFEVAAELRNRHLEQFKPRKALLQAQIDRVYSEELARMTRQFAATGLEEQSTPLLGPLNDYLYWLRWCSWCSLHLAAPLDLDSDLDVQRMVSAMIIYSGPRVMDDALDQHVNYKTIRSTFYGELTRVYPSVENGTLRSQVMLIGIWVVLYGAERLRRYAGDEVADRTLRLLRRIVPGAVIESLFQPPLTRMEYQALVRCKAAYYDGILYSALLAPVEERLRSVILGVTSDISSLAQHLNDLGDGPEDLARGQHNAGKWYPGAHKLMDECRSQAERIWQTASTLPTNVRGALAAILCETLDSAKGPGFSAFQTAPAR